MELYMVRHAQSANNALPEREMTRRVCDPALTRLGHRQAELVGRHLAEGINLEMTVGGSEEATHVSRRRGYGLTRLYCSAMHRAMLTAGHIGRATGLTPEIWLDVHESGGIFDGYPGATPLLGRPGRNRPEILAEFPHYILPAELGETGWWNRPHEDEPACAGRAIRVAETLRRMAATVPDGERVAMVSHGGFMDALLKALVGRLPGDGLFYHHFNTAITRLDLRPNGHVDVRYLNRVPHLPPDLVS